MDKLPLRINCLKASIISIILDVSMILNANKDYISNSLSV